MVAAQTQPHIKNGVLNFVHAEIAARRVGCPGCFGLGSVGRGWMVAVGQSNSNDQLWNAVVTGVFFSLTKYRRDQNAMMIALARDNVTRFDGERLARGSLLRRGIKSSPEVETILE